MPYWIKWINDSKENITWFLATAGTFFVVARWVNSHWYLPGKKFIHRWLNAMSELENNGGGSMKDIAAKNQVTLQKISKDITTMKATQEAEFQLNPDCKFECAADGRCVKVNDALCRLFGATDSNKMLGFGWLSFIKSSEQDHARQVWEDAVETDNVINSSYTIVNGVTNEEIKCAYVAYIKRASDTNEIISIFGVVNKKS